MITEKKFKKNKKSGLNIWIFGAQIGFLVCIIVILYVFYPQADYSVQGNVVKFNSLNSDLIVISKNPDFSNPKYVNFEEREEAFVKLDPGNYYWKPANNFLRGFKKEIKIESELAMEIHRNSETGDDAELRNVGNVKINVTRNEKGVLVGYITIDTKETKRINDSGKYVGRQID